MADKLYKGSDNRKPTGHLGSNQTQKEAKNARLHANFGINVQFVQRMSMIPFAYIAIAWIAHDSMLLGIVAGAFSYLHFTFSTLFTS